MGNFCFFFFFYPLKIFAGVQAIQKHKMLLFAKVPSSNQADFPLPLNWNDKHTSLPGIWHPLWFFFFMSKWQTLNYQGYLIFSCSNLWWHFFPHVILPKSLFRVQSEARSRTLLIEFLPCCFAFCFLISQTHVVHW